MIKLILLNSILLLSFYSCKKGTEHGAITSTSIQKEHLDISYATGSNAQKLDIFLPDTIKPKSPVLVWIHGGGWKGGDKSEFRNSNRLTELKKEALPA